MKFEEDDDVSETAKELGIDIQGEETEEEETVMEDIMFLLLKRTMKKWKKNQKTKMMI